MRGDSINFFVRGLLRGEARRGKARSGLSTSRASIGEDECLFSSFFVGAIIRLDFVSGDLVFGACFICVWH